MHLPESQSSSLNFRRRNTGALTFMLVVFVIGLGTGCSPSRDSDQPVGVDQASTAEPGEKDANGLSETEKENVDAKLQTIKTVFEDVDLRIEVAQQIADMGPRVVPYLMSVLENARREDAIAVVPVLKAFGKQAVSPAFELYRRKDGRVMEMLVLELGANSIAPLVDILSMSEESGTRKAAGVTERAASDLIAVLETLTLKGKPDVSVYVLPDETRERLLKVMSESSSWQARQSAAESMKWTAGGEKVKDVLRSVAQKDESFQVRRKARECFTFLKLRGDRSNP